MKRIQTIGYVPAADTTGIHVYQVKTTWYLFGIPVYVSVFQDETRAL